jgi:hypothetical protein
MKTGSARRFLHKFQDVTVKFTDLKINLDIRSGYWSKTSN